MVTVYVLEPKDRPHYQAQWLDPATGKRKTRSLRTADPTQADRKAAELEDKLNAGQDVQPARMAWEAFAQRYAEEHLPGLRDTTQNKRRSLLRTFAKRAAPTTLGRVDARLLSHYVARMRSDGMQPSSIRADLMHLRAILAWGVRQGLLARVPHMEMPKVPRRRSWRIIDPAQWPAVRGLFAGPAWGLYLDVLWYTGMRRTEALLLRWERQQLAPWVDFARNRIQIPAAAQKSGEESWLPVHPELAARLEPGRQQAGQVAAPGEVADLVSKEFRRKTRKAGLDFTLHDIRRSFGTRYAAKVPAQVLQRLMRHAHISTTLEYYVDQDVGLEASLLLG